MAVYWGTYTEPKTDKEAKREELYRRCVDTQVRLLQLQIAVQQHVRQLDEWRRRYDRRH